ncbi:MAG: hypothetical protein Q7S00_01155, partial [bacterium]|nr:hypothetical protein [bacterium]
AVPGVDVPFHSPILYPGVAAFRKTLETTIPDQVNPSLLCGRYIPNLNAIPFSLDRDYAESLYQFTVTMKCPSPVLKKILEAWKTYSKKPEALSRLLLIELLAYQFASPVQWIRTQKVLVADPAHAVERIIEIGPSPVLSNMMKATLSKLSPVILPEVYQFEQDREKVFYQVSKKKEEKEIIVGARSPRPDGETQPLQEQVSHRSQGPAPTDKPFGVTDGLKTLLALKLNLSSKEIKESSTLETLSGGNSARRNELLTDIGGEFQVGAIDDAASLPFPKLAAVIAAKTSYSKPGPFLQKAINRAVQEKLPIGLAEIKKYFQEERMLPNGRTESAVCSLSL